MTGNPENIQSGTPGASAGGAAAFKAAGQQGCLATIEPAPRGRKQGKPYVVTRIGGFATLHTPKRGS